MSTTELHYGGSVDRREAAAIEEELARNPNLLPPRIDLGDPGDLEGGDDTDDLDGDATETPSLEPTGLPRPASDVVFASGRIDPQIAVGHTYVVVSSGNTVTFRRKSDGLTKTWGSLGGFGKLIMPTTCHPASGPPVSYCNDDNLNHQLNLDVALCDPTGEVSDPDDWCLKASQIYDTRLRFEPSSGRFFILAHVRNHGWPKFHNSLELPENANHRSKTVLAVTHSEDPDDGWDLFWFDHLADAQSCTTLLECAVDSWYLPGQASDYPTFIVDHDHLVVAENVKSAGWVRDLPLTTQFGAALTRPTWPYQLLNVVPVAPLLDPAGWSNSPSPPERVSLLWNLPAAADSAPPSPTCWDRDRDAVCQQREDIDGSGSCDVDDCGFLSGGLRPVERLDHDERRQYFVRTVRPDRVEVFWIDWAPFAFDGRSYKVSSFNKVVDAPLADGSSTYTFSNMGNSVGNAVVRDGRLVLTFTECVNWAKPTTAKGCAASPRVVVFDVTGPTPSLLADRRHGADDGNAHGWPGVTVTHDGQIALVYGSGGPTLAPSIDYTLMRNRGWTIPGRLWTGSGDANIKPDTAGIAIDPDFSKRVWMAHLTTVNGPSNTPIVKTVVGAVDVP